MDSDFLNIVANKDRLQKELVFYSLYLMIFENFVSDWKEKSLDFYSNWRIKDEQTGKYYYFVKTELVDGEFRSTRDMEKEKRTTPHKKDVFGGLLIKDRIILVSTHIITDIESLCDNICFMNDGRLVKTEQNAGIEENYKMSQIENEYMDVLK